MKVWIIKLKSSTYMRGTFIISLIFALLITIFTIQNASIITVKLFVWEFSISLAIIILICLTIGAVVVILLSLRKEMNLKKENKRLLNEIAILKEKMRNNKISSDEDIVHEEKNN